MDLKAQNKSDLLQEWHEYLRKRSEIELEYAKTLERMTDRFQERLNRIKNPQKT